MFLPTHMALGALIDKAAGGSWKRKLLIAAPLGLGSHAILDFFNVGSQTLYHGPMSAGLTSVVMPICALAVLLLIWKARQYWIGMTFAALPDLEWVIIGAFDLDKTQGLHHKLFWPPCLATEYGLLVQAGIFALLLGAIIWRKDCSCH